MKTRIWTALITVYIVWGSTYLAIRFAVETMPPFIMAAIRFLVAGGILYVWRRLAGDPIPKWIEGRSALIVGLLLLVGGSGASSAAAARSLARAPGSRSKSRQATIRNRRRDTAALPRIIHDF